MRLDHALRLTSRWRGSDAWPVCGKGQDDKFWLRIESGDQQGIDSPKMRRARMEMQAELVTGVFCAMS